MILKMTKDRPMFQKLAPLIVLALFVAGMYFMLKGMDNAVALAKPAAKTATQP